MFAHTDIIFNFLVDVSLCVDTIKYTKDIKDM